MVQGGVAWCCVMLCSVVWRYVFFCGVIHVMLLLCCGVALCIGVWWCDVVVKFSTPCTCYLCCWHATAGTLLLACGGVLLWYHIVVSRNHC